MGSLAIALTACGSPERDASSLAAGSASSSAQASAGLAVDVNTGGMVNATISGATSASVVMTDVSFCVKQVSAGSTTLSVFAMAANNSAWALSLTNSSGVPSIGSHAIDPANPTGLGASIVEKSTGSQPSEWQQYKVAGGNVTITAADAKHVAGSYEVTGSPSYPRSAGPPVTMKGTFDAPPAAGCNLAEAGVR